VRARLAITGTLVFGVILLTTAVVPARVDRSTEGSLLDLPNDRPALSSAVAVPLNCTDRATLPQVDDVTAVSWSPDSTAIALVRVVTVPSTKTITGYEEDQRFGVMKVATGAIRELGHGSRPAWSASGAFLSYWDEDGSIHVLLSGEIVAEIDATQPGMVWSGESLLYWKGDEIRAWDSGVMRTVATVDPSLVPRYPYDDAYFSADGTQFTITRYAHDGTSLRYVGTTATGAMAPIGDGNTTFVEWSPRGATLLLRSATALSLRGPDGSVQNEALATFRGPVHGWTAGGRLMVGTISATAPGGNALDRFAIWNDGEAVATIPNLLGSRSFSPDGRWFAGVSRTGLYTTKLELYRCGVVAGTAGELRPDTASRARAQILKVDDRRLVRPVAGAITQFLQGSHTGIDIAAPVGSILVAADDGIVGAVGWVPVGGFRVCVMHAGGLETCNYHTSLSLVSVGERVVRGQPVALVGMTGLTTGPHVHWEAKLDGRIVNPLAQ
jgi:hypothetical protein